MRPRLRMTIGTDPAGIGRAGAAFAEFAADHAVPVPVRRSVSVAIDEILSNTVRHGFAGRPGGALTIEVELGADRLGVVITDDGEPFDPFTAAPPDTGLSVEERQAGGLGIHLVRQLMDEAGYERRDGRNVVTLAKRLQAES